MKLKTPSLLFFLFSTIGLLAASAATADQGVDQFKALKCSMCHPMASHDVEATIKKVEMQGPDLSTIGDEHDAAWLKKWLLQEVELEGKKHKSKWKGSTEDLEAISAWMATLKKE